jgi:hypothetical protein
MLRVLALSCLISGVCSAAHAQALQLHQDAANNYAVIAPGNASTAVELSQKGKNNAALTQQDGAINWAEVNQRGNNNLSEIYQYGHANTAIVTQAHNFRTVNSLPTTYVAQQTGYGYLSEFTSGGVSILALTGPSNTLVSAFGRNH